jgi:hypothetical protein
LKNRIHATLAKYAVSIEGASDLFGKRGRKELQASLGLLPPHSRFAVERLLETLEVVQKQMDLFEQRMKEVFATSRELEILQTLPGVGFILAVVILLEVGDISRFADAPRFAGYSGTTPRVSSSGGEDSLWTASTGCQSLSEVGLHRSRECGLFATWASTISACESALPENLPTQGSPEGSGRGGSSPGGGNVLGLEKGGRVSGTEEENGFVHEGISAALA